MAVQFRFDTNRDKEALIYLLVGVIYTLGGAATLGAVMLGVWP